MWCLVRLPFFICYGLWLMCYLLCVICYVLCLMRYVVAVPQSWHIVGAHLIQQESSDRSVIARKSLWHCLLIGSKPHSKEVFRWSTSN